MTKMCIVLVFLVTLTNPYILIKDGDYETSKLHLTCDSRQHILKLVPRLYIKLGRIHQKIIFPRNITIYLTKYQIKPQKYLSK